MGWETGVGINRVREHLLSFGHCPNFQPNFVNTRILGAYGTPNPHLNGKMQFKVQIIGNLEDISHFIDQEVDCGKRAKKIGQGPPPRPQH